MFKYMVDIYSKGKLDYSDTFIGRLDLYKNLEENNFHLYHEDYMSLGVL